MMTLTEMTDLVELNLVDSSNAVFTAANIQSIVAQCLKEVATEVPYTIKEERFTTDGSRDIDVSEVVNLIRVVETEYEVDQYPKELRSVERFGDNITIAITAEPDDDESVYLYCEKIHTLVDPPSSLAGAVNNAAGYSEGDTSIILDGLGTGTIKANTLVVFTGIAGEYRVTADATITANAATIVITPGLLEDMDDDTVVTFRCSTLTDPRMESLFAQYVANMMALSWVGKARIEVQNAITAILLINSSVDSTAARITQIVTDAGTARTAASANFTTLIGYLTAVHTTLNTDVEGLLDTYATKIGDLISSDAGDALDILTLADTAIDDAEGVADEINADIDAQLTKIGNAAAASTTELSQAIDDLDDVESNLNVVTIGSDPAGKGTNKAMAQISLASAKWREIQSFLEEGYALSPSLTSYLQTSREYVREARTLFEAEVTLNNERIAEIRERVRMANATIQNALAMARADAQKVSNLYRVISAEAQAVNGYLRQANGYASEVSADLSTARTIKNFESTAINGLSLCKAELRKLRPPQTKRRHPRD